MVQLVVDEVSREFCLTGQKKMKCLPCSGEEYKANKHNYGVYYGKGGGGWSGTIRQRKEEELKIFFPHERMRIYQFIK